MIWLDEELVISDLEWSLVLTEPRYNICFSISRTILRHEQKELSGIVWDLQEFSVSSRQSWELLQSCWGMIANSHSVWGWLVRAEYNIWLLAYCNFCWSLCIFRGLRISYANFHMNLQFNCNCNLTSLKCLFKNERISGAPKPNQWNRYCQITVRIIVN